MNKEYLFKLIFFLILWNIIYAMLIVEYEIFWLSTIVFELYTIGMIYLLLLKDTKNKI